MLTRVNDRRRGSVRACGVGVVCSVTKDVEVPGLAPENVVRDAAFRDVDRGLPASGKAFGVPSSCCRPVDEGASRACVPPPLAMDI